MTSVTEVLGLALERRPYFLCSKRKRFSRPTGLNSASGRKLREFSFIHALLLYK